ncbi:MAG: hypothetical protein ACTHM6_19330 [Tepidisphaeraceae bacterium]
MTNSRWIAIIALIVAACLLSSGCDDVPKYGREKNLFLPGQQQRVWAVAPVINLSGQPGVDPLLQADLLYQQLQTVQGLTVIPVDRVAQVYAAAGIEQIQTPQQADVVLNALGCDGLIVATVTQYAPYNPPKFGGALQLFQKPDAATPAGGPDPRVLLREGAPKPGEGLTSDPGFLQVVGMYDAANGSVRDGVVSYAAGRHEPTGPLGVKEYFANMDRYCGFAYYSLIDSLLVHLRNGR